MSAESVIAVRYALVRGVFSLDVDVELPLNGITGVYGVSGAGKTTLLRCIAGLEQPEQGRLVVAGETWEDADRSRATHERAIGYVFQEPRLFDHLTVHGNIEYGMRRRDALSSAEFEATNQMLGIGHLLSRNVRELSGGEAQRVAIARALLCAPRFVLMDEPLASLDVARKNEILPFLDRLHQSASVPIVYVSHNIDEICRLCDHLIVLDAGRVAARGALQDVLTHSALPMLTGDEAGTVIDAIIGGYDSNDELLQLNLSRAQLWVPGQRQPAGTPVRLRIRANDVSLCRERPKDTTILNIVPAIIEDLQADVGASVRVRIAIGDDLVLARVTKRSVRELGLREGEAVLAQIKSVAVRAPVTSLS